MADAVGTGVVMFLSVSHSLVRDYNERTINQVSVPERGKERERV